MDYYASPDKIEKKSRASSPPVRTILNPRGIPDRTVMRTSALLIPAEATQHPSFCRFPPTPTPEAMPLGGDGLATSQAGD